MHVVVPDGRRRPGPAERRQHLRPAALRAALAALGWEVHEHAVPGAWPRPDAASRRPRWRRCCARLPDGAVVLLDGLVASPVPRCWCRRRTGCGWWCCVHMPLGRRRTAAERCARASGGAAGASRRRDHQPVDPATGCSSTYALRPGRGRTSPRPGSTPPPASRGTPTGGELLCVGGGDRRPRATTCSLAALAASPDLAWCCTCVGTLERDPAFVDRLRAPGRRARDRGPGAASPGALGGAALDAAYAARRPAGAAVARRRPTGWSSPRRWPAASRCSRPGSAALPGGAGPGTPTGGVPGSWCRPTTRSRSRRAARVARRPRPARHLRRRPRARRCCPPGGPSRRRPGAHGRGGPTGRTVNRVARARRSEQCVDPTGAPRPGGRIDAAWWRWARPLVGALVRALVGGLGTGPFLDGVAGRPTPRALPAGAVIAVRDHAVLRLALEPGRPPASGVDLSLAGGRRRVLPRAVPQHRRCPAGSSATWTARCGTAARPATSAVGCGRSRGSASAGQVVLVVLTRCALLLVPPVRRWRRLGRRRRPWSACRVRPRVALPSRSPPGCVGHRAQPLAGTLVAGDLRAAGRERPGIRGRDRAPRWSPWPATSPPSCVAARTVGVRTPAGPSCCRWPCWCCVAMAVPLERRRLGSARGRRRLGLRSRRAGCGRGSGHGRRVRGDGASSPPCPAPSCCSLAECVGTGRACAGPTAPVPPSWMP